MVQAICHMRTFLNTHPGPRMDSAVLQCITPTSLMSCTQASGLCTPHSGNCFSLTGDFSMCRACREKVSALQADFSCANAVGCRKSKTQSSSTVEQDLASWVGLQSLMAALHTSLLTLLRFPCECIKCTVPSPQIFVPFPSPLVCPTQTLGISSEDLAKDKKTKSKPWASFTGWFFRTWPVRTTSSRVGLQTSTNADTQTHLHTEGLARSTLQFVHLWLCSKESSLH